MLKLEIVRIFFYKEDFRNQLFLGTSHIKLIDFNINLRGVYFKKRKDFWFTSLPSIISVHSETKNKVKYPFFSFDDRQEDIRFQLQVKQLLKKEVELLIMQKIMEK